MIRSKTARQMLYDWHAGQSSPFYAAASSGLVANWLDLLRECGAIDDAQERDKLREYLKSWQFRAPIVTASNGKAYPALPWAREYTKKGV